MLHRVCLWRGLPYPVCTLRHTHTRLRVQVICTNSGACSALPWVSVGRDKAHRGCLQAVSFSAMGCPTLAYQEITSGWDESPQPAHTERLLLPPVSAAQPHPSRWNKNNPVCPQISSHQGMAWALAQEFKGRLDKQTPWWSDSCWPGSDWRTTREHLWNHSLLVMGNATASGSFKWGKNLLVCEFFFCTNSYPE